jgi:hypothetical protein
MSNGSKGRKRGESREGAGGSYTEREANASGIHTTCDAVPTRREAEVIYTHEYLRCVVHS